MKKKETRTKKSKANQGGIKILSKEIIRKINEGKEACSCGKTYDVYTAIYKIIYKRGKKKFNIISKERVGYPQQSCHCSCGKKWGEHFEE